MTNQLNDHDAADIESGSDWIYDYQNLVTFECYTGDLKDPSASARLMMANVQPSDIYELDNGDLERLLFCLEDWQLDVNVLGTNLRFELRINPKCQLSVVDIMSQHNVVVHHLTPTIGELTIGDEIVKGWYHDTPWEDPDYRVTTHDDIIANMSLSDAAKAILFDHDMHHVVVENMASSVLTPTYQSFMSCLGSDATLAYSVLTQEQQELFNQRVNHIVDLQRRLVDAANDFTGWVESLDG